MYLEKYGIYLTKTVIYWSKTIDNFMGSIRQKLWDIFAKTKGYIPKNYGIYWAKLWDILG